MRVVFLDIDGVLNQYSEKPRHETHDKMQARGWHTFSEHWCPLREQTHRLLQITNALPDTYIVISSAWRNRAMDFHIWECMLYAAGGHNLPVRLCYESLATPKLWLPRGLEIQAWLDQWPGDYLAYHKKWDRIKESAPEIESFVIIDDERDMEHLMDRLVHVDGEVGLQDSDVEKAIKILKTPISININSLFTPNVKECGDDSDN